ncbi:MAG: hypothetical protein WD894_06890 [Pirellulales bacterium]
MEHGRIHSVELLELALQAAAQLGYRIREDALGFPGGACQLKGQKWLFVDPTLSSRERLQLVLDALAADPITATTELPPPLAQAVKQASAA